MRQIYNYSEPHPAGLLEKMGGYITNNKYCINTKLP